MCKCHTCGHALEVTDGVLHCAESLFEDCSPEKGECRSCKTIPECKSYVPETSNPTYWVRLANL